MKIGFTVFNVFKSARLQDKALYRRSLYRLWDCTGGGLFGRTGGRRTAYFKKDPRITYSQKGRNSERPYHLGSQAPLGRGSEAASEKRPSAFVANRACHPGLPLELENLMTEMRMFWIIDKDNRYKTKQRLMEEPCKASDL